MKTLKKLDKKVKRVLNSYIHTYIHTQIMRKEVSITRYFLSFGKWGERYLISTHPGDVYA